MQSRKSSLRLSQKSMSTALASASKTCTALWQGDLEKRGKATKHLVARHYTIRENGVVEERKKPGDEMPSHLFVIHAAEADDSHPGKFAIKISHDAGVVHELVAPSEEVREEVLGKLREVLRSVLVFRGQGPLGFRVVTHKDDERLLVCRVSPTGAAGQLGLIPGACVTHVNDEKVPKTADGFVDFIKKAERPMRLRIDPGTTFSVDNNNNEEEEEDGASASTPPLEGLEFAVSTKGFAVVTKVNPGSRFSAGGVEVGDVVVGCNDKALDLFDDAAAFEAAVEAFKSPVLIFRKNFSYARAELSEAQEAQQQRQHSEQPVSVKAAEDAVEDVPEEEEQHKSEEKSEQAPPAATTTTTAQEDSAEVQTSLEPEPVQEESVPASTPAPEQVEETEENNNEEDKTPSPEDVSAEQPQPQPQPTQAAVPPKANPETVDQIDQGRRGSEGPPVSPPGSLDEEDSSRFRVKAQGFQVVDQSNPIHAVYTLEVLKPGDAPKPVIITHRYNDFFALKETLSKQNPQVASLNFPPKTFLRSWSLKPDTMALRKSGFESWLNDVLNISGMAENQQVMDFISSSTPEPTTTTTDKES